MHITMSRKSVTTLRNASFTTVSSKTRGDRSLGEAELPKG